MSLVNALLSRLARPRSEKLVARWRLGAARIGELEPQLTGLSDEQLKERALDLKARVRARYEGELAGDLKKFSIAPAFHPQLLEAFAIGREASRRVLGMRHFDEQLIGGLALHEAKLAEMRTGEGKTLVITLPALYNALAGVPTYVVTVNDYLARRDSEAMRPLYEFFGLSVGLLRENQDPEEKRQAYESSIVYGVNHEFGFDYLRENMALSKAGRRMRGLGFAIVDEVDSILIDEARTPLIISGPDDDDLSMYPLITQAVETLQEGEHAEVDRKTRSVSLTEAGFEALEARLMGLGLIERSAHLYEPSCSHVMRVAQAALQARFLFIRDKQYIVKEGKALIVDEMTGRLMADRRWANGIHQAVESKEGLEIQQENKTLATITYQNFFRLFPKLSGLTGTAMTQAEEFGQIYGLECVPIPTHRPLIRVDRPDVMYRTLKEKWAAIGEQIRQAQAKGQPVLAGTSSIEDSEALSAQLSALGIHHETLNAKNHALEAGIIEQAGAPGKVTVATNMAGRGTDIILGGNLEARLRAARETGFDDEATLLALRQGWESDRAKVLAAGGLLVIGSCRNESRRVDNQLRGRSGRQGDPGESRFVVSLEDEMFRVFAQSGFVRMIDRYNMMPEGVALEHPMLNRSLERAQTAMESHHYNMRKQLIEYDDVGARQRSMVYGWRNELIDEADASHWGRDLIEQSIEAICRARVSDEELSEHWDLAGLREELLEITGWSAPLEEWEKTAANAEELIDRVLGRALELWSAKRAALGEQAAELERACILRCIDEYWQEHLTRLQGLLEGIHLRAYAQKNPKQEYTKDAYHMFKLMSSGIARSCAKDLFALRAPEPFEAEGPWAGEAAEGMGLEGSEEPGSPWPVAPSWLASGAGGQIWSAREPRARIPAVPPEPAPETQAPRG